MRDLPNYPLTRLGCLAFCFPARRLPARSTRRATALAIQRTGPAAPLGRGGRRQMAWV